MYITIMGICLKNDDCVSVKTYKTFKDKTLWDVRCILFACVKTAFTPTYTYVVKKHRT